MPFYLMAKNDEWFKSRDVMVITQEHHFTIIEWWKIFCFWPLPLLQSQSNLEDAPKVFESGINMDAIKISFKPKMM